MAKAYRHTEKVLLDNLDKLQAVSARGPKCVGDSAAKPIPLFS